jgi:HEAT repeat protein
MEGLQDKVTINFSGLPLPTGLEKLLMSANYVLLEKSTPHEDPHPVLLLIIGKRGIVVDKSEAVLGDQETVPGWRDLDPNLRLAQVQETGRPALQQGIDILSAAARDTDPSIRQLAYSRLFEQGEKEKLAKLLKQAIASADSDRRQTAVEALGQFFAADAADLLRDATADEHPDVRHAAFQQLSHIDSAEAQQVIVERLAHPNAEIRLMAIEAMAARGETVAREAATVLLYDSDELVRSKAAGLLQELEAQEEGAK